MRCVLVAVALLAACRNEPSTKQGAGRDRPASAVSARDESGVAVPKLPRTEDGAAELAKLDRRIAAAKDLATAVGLRLERASILGRLEDYEHALAGSAKLVAEAPRDEHAWQLRIRALLATHAFAEVPAAIARLGTLVHESFLVEHEVALAHATGDLERALALRAAKVQQRPSAYHLTLLAATLADAGRVDEAIALVPEAAAAVRDNPVQLIAWLLFQWGRLHEQAGSPAVAREYFAAARARLPGHVDATAHLARAMIATGDRAGARALVDGALAENRHPELLGLAVELGDAALAAEARAAWERYVDALPLAFADHAARFYLGPGNDAPRALELARTNLANRDTGDARALVVEAALAANEPPAACDAAQALATAASRAHRFAAWKALSTCGKAEEADRLARDLGIAR